MPTVIFWISVPPGRILFMYFAPDTLSADTGAETTSIRISNAGITIVVTKDLWKIALISYS
jgi:hypothetical protein